MSEIEIDEKNFEEYFFDTRKFKPLKGQVIVRYSAMAELVDGEEKRHLIDLLRQSDKAFSAVQIMQRLLHAPEPYCYSVLREMAEDLAGGMTDDEVAEKPYKYKIELDYYTDPENFPKDDPHWSCISELNLDDFIDREKGIVMKSKIIGDENVGSTD